MDEKERNELRWLHESAMVKLDASNKRSFILCVILLIVLLASNGAWIYYESQFQDETSTSIQMIEAEQDADNGGNNIIVGGNYGKAEDEGNNSNNH